MRRVSRLVALSLVAVGWLVVLTAQLPAEQPLSPLRLAMRATGTAGLQSLRYVAFGATYAAGTPARQPLPRYEGSFDTTPHACLEAATREGADVRRVALGIELSFETAGRRHACILNDQYLVDRVQVWVHDPVGGEVLVETFYRDYQRVGRMMFPMHITQDRASQPAFDLWVSTVEARHDNRALQ
jgi:hypothetical protein